MQVDQIQIQNQQQIYYQELQSQHSHHQLNEQHQQQQRSLLPSDQNYITEQTHLYEHHNDLHEINHHHSHSHHHHHHNHDLIDNTYLKSYQYTAYIPMQANSNETLTPASSSNYSTEPVYNQMQPAATMHSNWNDESVFVDQMNVAYLPSFNTFLN